MLYSHHLYVQKHYEDLKRSLSEEFNKKMTYWGHKKLSKVAEDGAVLSGLCSASSAVLSVLCRDDHWPAAELCEDNCVIAGI